MNYSIYADTTTGFMRGTKIRNSLGELGFTKLYDSGFSSVGSAGWLLLKMFSIQHSIVIK
jgi:hypothetical protein